jgi:4-carboxymuconolactone decarboxylase
LRKVGAGDPILGVFGTLAHSPAVAKRVAVLIAGLFARTRLPAREREIVILRMGWRCGSVYEFSEHTRIGLECGLSDEEIIGTTEPSGSRRLAARDRILLEFVDELYDANAISDETWEKLEARWSPQELIELLVVAGAYWMVSSVLNATRVRLEDGAAGWPSTNPAGPDPGRALSGP